MQIYGLANGYTPDEAESPAIVVDIIKYQFDIAPIEE